MEIFNSFSANIIGLCLGIGLAAAAGFRVFIPLFALSVAQHFNLGNYIGLSEMASNFKWVGELPALITLGVATLVEIGAYYIPVVDNFLDSIAVPLAAIAGTFLMASQLVHFPELITWVLAIIAGGGTAAAISGTTATGRATSTLTTAGTGNFAVATAEAGAATAMSALAIFVPIIAAIFVLILLFFVYKTYKYFKNKLNVMKENYK